MNAAVNPAFCYVTDISYLAPTLMSISSLRRNLSGNFPVFLVLTLKETDLLPDLKPFFDQLSVTFLFIDHKFVENMSDVWAASHVSKAALGRLLLHDILPRDIERIVYLDGDTIVQGDLSALATASIPKGRIGMVEDAMSFYRKDKSDNGRSTREYLSRIGLGPDEAYGNSGVMVASREDWKSLSFDAIAYLQHSSERCPPYHDQSAINAVIGNRRLNLSTRWNYQSRYAQWDGTTLRQASILHFTGAEKPWMGSVYPWEYLRGEISALMLAQSHFNLPVKTMSSAAVNAYNSQFTNTTYKMRKHFDLRLRRRPKLMLAYNETCLM